MKRLLLGLLIGILALFVGVVSAHEHGVHVRFVHLSASSPTVDVYIGETLAVNQLSFKATSGYLPLDSNMTDVAIVPAGGALADAVYTDTLVFSGGDNGYYTVVAVGDLADLTFELVILPEDAQPLGTAKTENLVIRGAFARPTVSAHTEGMSHDMDMNHDHDMAEATAEATMEMGNMNMAEATAEATMEMGGHSMGGMGSVSAVYMIIENRGDAPDRLIAASIELSNMVQIHQTTVVDGVAQMGEVEGGVEIPAGGIAELRPGGYHIMLMDLTGDLVEGKTITVTLTFEVAGEVTIEVPIITPR